jgi:tRNA(Arg) A34 adenosine deaminase TadA
LTETDRNLLRETIELARLAREHGNHPFGSLLADAEGNVLLRAENTVITENDCTGHAETNLMRMASKAFSPEQLADYTLYTSTEPCPMCAGAIFWGNVRRVVYALGQEGLYSFTGDSPEKLALSCRKVFASSGKSIEVIGPTLESEAREVHEGFWK